MENKVNELSYLKLKTQPGFQGFGADRFCRIHQESLTGSKTKIFPNKRRYNKIVDNIKNQIRIRNIIINILIKIAITSIQIPICLILSWLPVYLTKISEIGYLTGFVGGAAISYIGIWTFTSTFLQTNPQYITFKHKNKIKWKIIKQ